MMGCDRAAFGQYGALQERGLRKIGWAPVGVGGFAGAGGLDDLLNAVEPEGVALHGGQPGIGDFLVPLLLCHLR